MHDDDDEAFTHVKNLSFPRFCGGPGEEKARAYIVKSCDDAGLKTTLHHFKASQFPEVVAARIVLLFWGLILVLSLLFLKEHPLLSLVLLCIVPLSIFVLSRWHLFYEKMLNIPFPKELSSANIIARLPEEENQKAKPTVVFMAHYDSKAQLLPIYLRIAVIISGSIGSMLIAAILVVLIVFKMEGFLAFAYFGAIFIGLAMLLMFFNGSKDASPGAMDNATGVAVLLALARYYGKRGAPGVNLLFLFTGAEEIGLCGAVRFLETYEKDFPRESTYVVNLDGVGGKEKLLVIDRYGGFPPAITSRTLGKKAREIAASRGIKLHSLPLMMGALWDHAVWGAHGYESITLSIGGWERATLLIHGREDKWEHINPRALKLACDLCKDIAQAVGEGM